MKKQTCLKCNREVYGLAVRCDHCGTKTMLQHLDEARMSAGQDQSFISKKLLWIIIGLLLVYIVIHGLNSGNRIMTASEVKEAEDVCTKWGGKIIYDSNGSYSDCANVGE